MNQKLQGVLWIIIGTAHFGSLFTGIPEWFAYVVISICLIGLTYLHYRLGNNLLTVGMFALVCAYVLSLVPLPVDMVIHAFIVVACLVGAYTILSNINLSSFRPF